MTDVQIWTVILGLAVATFLIRFSFIGLLAGRKLPPLVIEALGFVPAAVLPAIIAPLIFLGPDGTLSADPARIVAATLAFAAGILGRNTLLTVVAGMLGFIVLRQLGL
jgi:branched-subunit amino acid transport protein